MTVQLKPSGLRQIRSAKAAAFECEEEAEELRYSNSRRMAKIDDFQGQAMVVFVRISGRDSALGWRDTSIQVDRCLAVLVEMDDGSKQFLTRPIGDVREEENRHIIVQVP